MNHRLEYPFASILLVSHLIALVFGLVGLLIMLPNPELWSSDPRAVQVFDWSMEHAGATHILFGAATMLAFGIRAIGVRKTLIFAVSSISISLGFELFGTGTGWPFGNYEYTEFLGYKVLGRVPWTIPLSWFYMGLASYLIGTLCAEKLSFPKRGIWSVFLGAWFLTAWDLVLDPAMAHDSLQVKFWIWDEQGPYFGMPVKNFVGWSLTGLIFMAASRKLWRADPALTTRKIRIPMVVYIANMAFAMIISANVGLWAPILLASVISLVPVTMILSEKRFVPGTPRLSTADDG